MIECNFFYLSVFCVFNQIISLKLLFYEIVVDFRWKQNNKKKCVINGVFFISLNKIIVF